MEKPNNGWNTYDGRSVLSHVHMPDGFALSLGIKNYQTGRVINDSLIGRRGAHEEDIHPGPRTVDGGYTSLL